MVHVVFDNESLLSVGGFPTATPPAAIWKGLRARRGFHGPHTVRTMEEFTAAFEPAIGKRRN